MKRMFLILAAVITLPLFAQTVEIAPATPVARRIKTLAATASSDVRNFYAPLGYRTVWSRDARPTPQAQALLALFGAAADKGLDPADYRVTPTTDAAEFDLALTTVAMRYVSDLHAGRLDPQNVDFDLDVTSKKLYLPNVVAQLAHGNAAAVIASFEPQHADYRRLQAALGRYRRIAAESSDEAPLPAVTKLSPNDPYAALPQLATKLRRLGDLAADAQVGNTYEGAIVDAVKKFQRRHGLTDDGIVSKRTFAALNLPAAQRVRQLELALERARWTASVDDAPSIVVNIPEFTLRAKDASGELAMRVVVGKANASETPVFGGGMKHVVFRPYWSVPPGIQRREIAPKAEKDHSWLARNGYELADSTGAALSINAANIAKIRTLQVSVRQRPGRSNALGLVKFLFPNGNNVYLHDTPSQSHFARERRDYSHGCIRVAQPEELAAWALRTQPEWTREKIRAAMQGERDDVYVKLERVIPVTITYATAVAHENGEVHFFEDIYGHDAQQLAKLGERAKIRLAQKSTTVQVAAR